MKKNTFAALALCAALALTGCGSTPASSSPASSAASSTPPVTASFGSYTNFDYQNFVYNDYFSAGGRWLDVDATALVTLPADYAAVPLDGVDLAPTDAEVQTEVNNLLASTATTRQVTDRAAANGDTVNIDYLGKVNGVAFVGGEAAGYNLTLGSGAFIGANGENKGFEEQIVGHIPGETFDITVTFPTGYDDSADAEGNVIPLSGTEAVFTVTLNHITETVVPELTDDWVMSNMFDLYGITKADEVAPRIHEDILYTNQANYIYDYLMDHATFGEVPAKVLAFEVNSCLEYYAGYAAYYGLTLEEFVTQVVGYGTVDELLASTEETILLLSRQDLLYHALGDAFQITVTDEDMAAYQNYVATYGENYVRYQVMINLVTDKLVQGATGTAAQ
ncbi:MAG: FKBP-type peptidyl-prolyl cis-trans isomerase [Faecalibacterium sp.]|nr:FKBP-type peptidyl-prolyl cis-trans isomerase [Faecalibacterium sp.]